MKLRDLAEVANYLSRRRVNILCGVVPTQSVAAEETYVGKKAWC
jgi:hypothetical protein